VLKRAADTDLIDAIHAVARGEQFVSPDTERSAIKEWLGGNRDERLDRAWDPPGAHWSDRPGLIGGRDVILDSTLLPAWSRHDPAAAWSFPSVSKGRVFGYKVHTLLDRASRLPVFFLLSSANRNDLPFAYPLLGFARLAFGPSQMRHQDRLRPVVH